MKIDLQATTTGPFFNPGKIADSLRENLRGAVEEVTDEGAEEARRIAQPFRRTGRYHGAIRGRMGKRLRGKVMVGAAAKKYRGYIERGAVRRGKVDRFKGYHTMRRARQAVEPQVPAIVRKHVGKIVRELT